MLQWKCYKVNNTIYVYARDKDEAKRILIETLNEAVENGTKFLTYDLHIITKEEPK